MRRDSGLKRFGIGLCAALLVASLAPLADAARVNPAVPFRMKPIKLKAGTLKGVIKGYTGKPYANTSLELLDEKGNVVAKTTTNARGEYVLKDIPPGKYTAVIGGKVKLPVTMTTESVVSRLMIVPKLPMGAAAGAGAGAGAGSGAATGTYLGLGTWAWVAIGGGVAAVAVAVPVAVANSKDDDDDPVSP